MNIEQEGDFAIQELAEDPNVTKLYQHQDLGNNSPNQPGSYQVSNRRKRRDVSEPSLRHKNDEGGSERAGKRGRQRLPVKVVVNRFDKNIRKNREKAYILMLENKVQTLQKEINKLKGINRANQEYIRKFSAAEQIITGTFVGRNQIYQRLDNLTLQQHTEQTRKEMIKQVSTLRYRLGVLGKDRIKAINYYFKQILQAFIPECQKFLVYTTCENFDFYRQSAVQLNKVDEQWRLEMLQDLNMNDDKIRLVESVKPAILEEKRKYDLLVMQFYNTKTELMKQAKILQNLVDSFRKFLNPFQLTKILVNIEKNKYRKQMTMNSIMRFWNHDFQDQNVDDSTPHSIAATGFGENWA